ncbi:hypothetical protein JWG45_12975 [Leptospira sp. 201903070]|uniref:DUF4381 domain-containing protein n=1 Tax=Leptospira ainlahdjerensis TaxID=2810033 RepID=A0ABS2UEU5_9LEPT|nr:hypothetical protein [Leptospira ainlahdjerensis]MBM9578063.1 hypothetical protein [Leptospira ainlahdjerensis]
MKNGIQIIVYSWILMFSSSLAGEAVETLSPDAVLVAQKVRYELKWTAGEIKEIVAPQVGIHFAEGVPDLPWFEVLLSEKKDTSIALEISFYTTGEFSIPVSWILSNGKRELSQKKVLVNSALSDSDTGPSDIIPPLSFSGSYLGRLLVFLVLFGILLAFGIYAFRLYAGQSSPLDAIIQTTPQLERMEVYEIRLQKLLKKDPIPAREFARLLSGYIREKAANLSGRKTASFTEAELFQFLYDQFPFEERELQSWKKFLIEKKFKPGETFLTKEDAEDKFFHWKETWDKS